MNKQPVIHCVPRSLVVVVLCFFALFCGSCSEGSSKGKVSEARSIIDDGTINGLVFEDLVNRFGKPNDEGYFSSWDNAFWMGESDSYTGVDSQWLVVNYGDDSLVKEARIVMD